MQQEAQQLQHMVLVHGSMNSFRRSSWGLSAANNDAVLLAMVVHTLQHCQRVLRYAAAHDVYVWTRSLGFAYHLPLYLVNQGCPVCPWPAACARVSFSWAGQHALLDMPGQHQTHRGYLALWEVMLCAVPSTMHTGETDRFAGGTAANAVWTAATTDVVSPWRLLTDIPQPQLAHVLCGHFEPSWQLVSSHIFLDACCWDLAQCKSRSDRECPYVGCCSCRSGLATNSPQQPTKPAEQNMTLQQQLLLMSGAVPSAGSAMLPLSFQRATAASVASRTSQSGILGWHHIAVASSVASECAYICSLLVQTP